MGLTGSQKYNAGRPNKGEFQPRARLAASFARVRFVSHSLPCGFLKSDTAHRPFVDSPTHLPGFAHLPTGANADCRPPGGSDRPRAWTFSKRLKNPTLGLAAKVGPHSWAFKLSREKKEDGFHVCHRKQVILDRKRPTPKAANLNANGVMGHNVVHPHGMAQPDPSVCFHDGPASAMPMAPFRAVSLLPQFLDLINSPFLEGRTILTANQSSDLGPIHGSEFLGYAVHSHSEVPINGRGSQPPRERR